jgi:Spy/CpxP family protein refolding chaperone
MRMKLNRQRIATLTAGVALVTSLLLAGPAIAGPGGGDGHRGPKQHGQRIEKMQAELGLSAEQVAQIKTIMESNKGEMKRLGEEMRAVFTPEQQAQMKSWREQRKEGQRPTREGMKEKFEQLGLTESQRAQLKSYREQMQAKRESIKAQIAAVLTPDQQARLDAKKAEWKAKRGERRGPRGGGQQQ